jgi:hypothetical protein
MAAFRSKDELLSELVASEERYVNSLNTFRVSVLQAVGRLLV